MKISIEPDNNELDSIESEVLIEIESAARKPVILFGPIGAMINKEINTNANIMAGR